ncbi:glutathionylspermidine synthase family protein, partial [Streptomyces lonegramiae]
MHEKLVARWGEIRDRLPGAETYFTWSGAELSGEDHVTVAYLQECAAEAGLNTVGLANEDIGIDADLHRYVDLAEAPMDSIFKLYPWEWMLDDDFGRRAVEQMPATMWVEPLWKTLLSNKAILAVLWE